MNPTVANDNPAQWSGPGARSGRRARWRWSGLLWTLVYPQGGHQIVPTISGLALIALSLGIGIAAYNSANNILFITLSLLLACLILSGVLSWLNLRGVSWRLQLSPPLRVGHDTTLALDLRNGKSFLPTYGLWFDLVLTALPPAETRSAVPPKKPAKSRPIREVLAAADKARTRARLFLRQRLDPRGEARLEWIFQPMRRGSQRISLDGVGSLFPFGFLRKQIGAGLRREVIVWPAAIEYRRWGSISARPQTTGERMARVGSGGDLLALRKYELGDSHRLIHWKASARTRQLLVRQFAAESQEAFVVWLQTSAEIWTRPEQFELLLSFAASLAEDLFRTGKLTSVAIDAQPPRPVRRGRDLDAFLDELALLQPAAEGVVSGATRSEERGSARKNVITFSPDGARGVAAYVDGEKTAAA